MFYVVENVCNERGAPSFIVCLKIKKIKTLEMTDVRFDFEKKKKFVGGENEKVFSRKKKEWEKIFVTF